MADFTVTITIENAKAADVLALATAWRARQLDENGNPKYATNGALGQAILIDALRRIIREQCEFAPASAPAWYKAPLDSKNTALSNIDVAVNAALQP